MTAGRFLVGATVLGLLLASPSSAKEDDPATRDAKAKVEFFDKHARRVKDDYKYAELVDEMKSTHHPVCAERIARILKKEKDLEHHMMAASALGEFTRKEEGRLAAGAELHELLDKRQKDFETEVLETMVDSCGKLKYKPAVPVLCEMLLKGGDPYLLLMTVRAVGNIEDWRALPTLLELWERHPVGYSWETGEVKVDTGAAGTADQEAAEAAWQAKYGSAGPKGKPPVMLRVYIQELVRAVHKITDDKKIEMPNDLRAWMEARREKMKEMGIEIPRFKGGSRAKEEEKQ